MRFLLHKIRFKTYKIELVPASLDHGTTHLVQYAELFLNKSTPPLVGR